MNIYENADIRNRLARSFPLSFINHNFELIIHPRRNSYISLRGVEDETELKAKLIDWLSREAIKGGTPKTMKYHLDGLNSFLGTHFTTDEMKQIYTYLGNAINHEKTVHFIQSGYDMSLLQEAHDDI